MIVIEIMLVTISNFIVTVIVLRCGENWPLLYLCVIASYIYKVINNLKGKHYQQK